MRHNYATFTYIKWATYAIYTVYILFSLFEQTFPIPPSISVFTSSTSDVEHYVLSVLSNARTSIFITTFNINHPGIIRLLKKKAEQNVQVYILWDHSQVSKAISDSLNHYNIHCYPIYKSNVCKSYFHPKILIIDRCISIISSANYTSSMQTDENIFLSIKNASFSKELLQSITTGNFRGIHNPRLGIRVLFLPKHSEWVLHNIIHTLRNSRTAFIKNAHISHPKILSIIKRCAHIKPIRIPAKNFKRIHSKYILANSTLILGSANFSKNGFSNNIEIVCFLYKTQGILENIYHDLLLNLVAETTSKK